MTDLIHIIRRIRPSRLKNYIYKIYFQYRKITWHQRPKPNFLIIGAQKAGTGSLYNYLRQHPQLSPSPLKKEVHFFDSGAQKTVDNFKRGETWYRAHFPRQQELPAGSKIFEATPLYLFHPLAPERIFKFSPDIKLIVLFRNPTDRAISHYFMTKRKNREPLPILDALKQEEARLKEILAEQDYKNKYFVQYTYKSRGRYTEQLSRYLEFFTAHQILLLCSEEFFMNPHRTLQRVFNFVGVDADYKIDNLIPRNVGQNKESVPLETREYLDGYFHPYNQALYTLTGINFNW